LRTSLCQGKKIHKYKEWNKHNFEYSNLSYGKSKLKSKNLPYNGSVKWFQVLKNKNGRKLEFDEKSIEIPSELENFEFNDLPTPKPWYEQIYKTERPQIDGCESVGNITKPTRETPFNSKFLDINL